MPRPIPTLSSVRFASLGLVALTLAHPVCAVAQTTPQTRVAAEKKPPLVLLNSDRAEQDQVNDVISLSGHVEIVQGPNMLLADRVTWNRSTDIVTATGDVKLVDDKGDVYFGDYLEITDDMREGFIENVSELMADNSRMVGRHAERKDGNITEIDRAIYSPCQLCAKDPTRPPTWQIKAVKVIHDTEEKRVYYHDATFELDGVPVLWTPYFSHYDPSVKRADGLLETVPGYRSQLGFSVRSRYYLDLAPDMDATVEGSYFNRQGPLLGGELRKRFADGQVEFSGSITESDIRQNPTPENQDEKTVRGHIFGNGEFDLSDNWRTGFEFARSLDNIYVRKYDYSSLDVLPTHFFAEGFYGRDYFNASLYSFQDLRPNIPQKQPYALPYITFSLLGDPGETLGGRWADTGSILTLERFPGERVQRLANTLSWNRELISDSGLVTSLNASAEADYYWTQDPQVDPITNKLTVLPSTGRFFPQAYAVLRYPLARPVGYAQAIIEPIMSVVVAPARANNAAIPNEDSQDVELDPGNLFTGNRYPGIDRMDDGSRITYGFRAGLYNLGTGYTSIFLGQSYRISGEALFAPNSGLVNQVSDYVGQIEIYPGRLVDIDYRFELSNDLREDRLQEVNFKFGPDRFGIYGTYLFAAQVNVPNFAALERNELTFAPYYKIDDNWTVGASGTGELTKPRSLLRASLNAGYHDDCSSFTLYITHDQTQPIGGTSGTGVFLQISLKNLGVFNTPNIH
jgi:LPS-assembly protein